MASASLCRSAFFGTARPLSAQPRQQRAAAPCRAVPVQAAIVGPGKKWEHLDLNQNGKPARAPMHVRLGDTVKVIAGGDKGKVGVIQALDTKRGMVVVEGVNIKTKHVKPAVQGESGQIVKREFAVHHSNVQLYSTAQQVVSRVGFKVVDGKKVRYLKKTGEVLPERLPKKEEKKEE